MDHFHCVALANRTVDAVRRRVQDETLRHRVRREDRYMGSAGSCSSRPNGSTAGWDRLISGLDIGDPEGALVGTWLANELLRKVFAAETEHRAPRAGQLNELTRDLEGADSQSHHAVVYRTTSGIGGACSSPSTRAPWQATTEFVAARSFTTGGASARA